jgi:hypothetical protein
MAPKKQNVADRLEALFKRLDEAKLAPETILKSEAQRENYESILMFAFRKLQAARYHRKRINEFVELQRTELIGPETRSKLKRHELKGGDRAWLRMSKSSNEFAFELCAFFAAIRSGVDFLAVACAQHMKEVQQATSIRIFLKLITNGKRGPILKVISEHAEWLDWLRDYRDYLVHRLVISTTSGGQIQWEGGKAVVTPYPILIPSGTPQHVPDTRRLRAFDEPESRFSVATSKAFITEVNGTKRVIEHSVKMEPVDGYIRIEDLMNREVAAFERFFVSIVEVLIEVDFVPTPLEKDSPQKA